MPRPRRPPGADRDAEVGLRQRRRVVDAVADHRDDRARGLEPPHLGGLLRRAAPRPAIRSGAMPTWRADRLGRRAARSPVIIQTSMPARLEAPDRLGGRRLHVSATAMTPMSRPSSDEPPRRLAPPRDRGVDASAERLDAGRAPGARGADERRRRPRRSPARRWPAIASKSGAGSAIPRSRRRRARSPRPADARCRARRAATRRQLALDPRPAAAARRPARGRPRVSVPVLSSTTVSTAARLLESRAVADQDPVLGALAGPDHDRRRRGEAHRAGAGDDEHGDRATRASGSRGSGRGEPAHEGERRGIRSPPARTTR